MKMQGYSHILYPVQAHEYDCRHVTHAKGCLGAPPSLGNHTLPRQMNSRAQRCIAQLGEVQPGILPQHSAGWEDVVG
jgi:hypothetical protein